MVSEVPCFKCREPNHCCTEETRDENLIMITLHDADRICKATGLKVEDFAEFRKVSDEKDLDEDEKYYFADGHALFMKKKNKKCVFLKDYKCSIHKNRPNLCRIYPFWYEGEGDNIKIVRMNSKKCDTCPATKKESRVCERVFNKMLETQESLKEVARKYNEELETYNKYKCFLFKYTPSDLLARLKKDCLI